MEAVASMEMASGGTSPSRQGAGTETSVPRIGVSRWWRRPWSLSGVSSIGIEVLGHQGLNRRRVGVGGATGPPHTRAARLPPRPRRPHMWGPQGTPLPPSDFLEGSGKNKMLGLRFVEFREYCPNSLSGTKNSRKQELALWHLVNRLVPENA